ncbi:DUF2058 domain-containing protein [Pleionea sp. CnH1-48]|uniref:DUF2058 domain-containing protein n=1 Tax=Pleionea sp. CnH1-48 TaxID=2954494 RepID=UPI002096B326|nr:DUF2058 domain-containing protein [Pleionea sp. CnH1-48]MCO7223186.1 DUF2058 domain-containing protein [Pleionea sp. CnH1-48]
MSSLQDQLLKAGLVDKQKAKQANTQKRKKSKMRRKGQAGEDEVKAEVEKVRAEKKAKDRQLNEEKQEELRQTELVAKIKQMLEQYCLKDIKGEIDYNFSHNGKVKKMSVDTRTQIALADGRLAICTQDDKYYLLTDKAAKKLANVDESVLVVLNDKVEQDTPDEDDPYAEYQIPDDLMW